MIFLVKNNKFGVVKLEMNKNLKKGDYHYLYFYHGSCG